jgi:hypothetical protein
MKTGCIPVRVSSDKRSNRQTKFTESRPHLFYAPISLSNKATVCIGLGVRYWHKADIGLRGVNVCFGVKAGIHRT